VAEHENERLAALVGEAERLARERGADPWRSGTTLSGESWSSRASDPSSVE
jgi:hypothetical protein